MGSNWNATRETGEPEHGGPGDASVWYSWTAPESGEANVSACAGRLVLLGLYSGQSLDTLTPVGSQEYSCQATLSANAGTTYWIAIDGELDPGLGGPALGTFSISVFMQLPLRPQGTVAAASPPDVIPPSTTIDRVVLKSGKRRATFGFDSTEPGSTFLCKIDRKPLAACTPPKTYKHLARKRHVFKVFAVDAAGNIDSTPAVVPFRLRNAS